MFSLFNNLIDAYTIRKKCKKMKPNNSTKPQRLSNMLLNNQWLTGIVKEEVKKYLETK